MTNPEITIETMDDPVRAGPARDQIQRGWRNLDWLEVHWKDLLPHARGRFLAVAGQESHIADSAEDAWAWTKTAHPDDDGAIVQYVRLESGPRIYAHCR